MVRSSEIVKKSTEEQEKKVREGSSPFPLLSDILNFNPSHRTALEDSAPAGDVATMPLPTKLAERVQQDSAASGKTIASEAPQRVTTLPNVASEQQFDNGHNVYVAAQNYMKDVRIAVIERGSVDISRGFDLVRKIVSQPEMVLKIHPLTQRQDNERDYYILQPVHTMIYALRIGFHMHYSKEQMAELGLSTLLQNIGMFLIPEDILFKKGPLTETEMAVIRKHPEVGRDLLLPYQIEKPWLLESVYQHHEREDGHGYPEGIKGDAIIEYAKIIGICDSYEAMTNKRPYKKAVLKFDSIKNLINSGDRFFSSHMLKLFLQEMTIYPVGSYVRLNNGAIGQVTATSRNLPLKPVIRIIIDGKGDRLAEEETVNLAENSVLSILEVISEDDLHH